MFDFDSYHQARSVEEAVALLVQNPQAVPLAGGTDILVRLHQGNPDYRHLVDIHDVSELKGVTLDDQGTLTIGSGTTFSQIIADPVIRERIPVLAQGAGSVGGPQVRNMATIGGNICNGAPSADSAAPLLVLNARVVLQGPQGQRVLPLEEFYQGPGKVDRQPAEIMRGLTIAADDYRCWSASYTKYAMRGAMDIATIGCAAAVKLEGAQVAGLRLAYTVAGPTPLRCRATEALARGAAANGELLDQVRASVLNDLRPRDSWRAAKAFRQQIIQVLAERVLTEALRPCGVSL
jgi:xanthine dehydrogenase FAD-binding subunit